MSKFTVRGRITDRSGWNEFTTDVDAENEAVAEEHLYATLGSRHGLKRRQIEIDEIEEAA